MNLTPNTITKLSETTPSQVQKLLEACGIRRIKQTDKGFELECPSCFEKRAYIYSNQGSRKIVCNRQNSCPRKTIELWDLIAEKQGISSQNNKKILEYINKTLGLEFKTFKIPQEEKKQEADKQLEDFLTYCSYIFKNKFKEKNDKTKLVWDYLKERGYEDEQIKQMELGYFPDKNELIKELKENYNFTKEKLVSNTFSGIFYKLKEEKDKNKQHRLVLTCYNNHKEVAGFIVRRICDGGKEKYLNSTGYQKSKHLFNLENFKGQKIVLVEGQFDALAGNFLTSKEIQDEYYFAAIGGNSVSLEQAKLLQDKNITEAIIFKDNDKAGEKYEKSVQNLTKHNIKTKLASISENYKEVKDIDELLRKYSDCDLDLILQEAAIDKTQKEKEDFLNQLSEKVNAEEKIRGDLIIKAEELEKEHKRITAKEELKKEIQNKKVSSKTIKEYNKHAKIANYDDCYTMEDFEKYIKKSGDGIKTGIKALDKEGIFFQPSSLAFVAGRPSSGKTTILLNMLVASIIDNPQKSYCYFSYEEDEGQILQKIILIASKEKDENLIENHTDQKENYFYWVQKYLRKQYSKGTQKEDNYISDTIEEAHSKVASWLDTGRLKIFKKETAVEDLQNKIIGIVKESKTPIGLVFIDYVQMLSTNKKDKKINNRQVEIQEVCDVLLNTTHEIKTPIVLGAQMNREAKEHEALGGLTLDRLRESGDIEQYANLVLGVWDETKYQIEKAEKALEKHKQGEKGISSDKKFKSYEEDKAKKDEPIRDIKIKVLKNRNGNRSVNAEFRIINDLFQVINEITANNKNTKTYD